MSVQGPLHFLLFAAVLGVVRGDGNSTKIHQIDFIIRAIVRLGGKQDSCASGKCMSDILDVLGGSYQLMPGVNISATTVAARSVSPTDALATFLKSLTLHVALYNEPIITLMGAAEKDNTGRAKRPKTSSRFKFLSVYTVFAVAFALLSGLVGKAMTMSILALGIAAIAAVRGLAFGAANNPNNSPPIYDIVRKPHVQVQHIHSAEEVYEAPGTGGGGVSYVYPIRGRAVPVPSDSYLPQTVQVSSQADVDHAERHIHIS